MNKNEKAFIKVLLEMEMEDLPMEKTDKVWKAYHSNKIILKYNMGIYTFLYG